jgi:hypothetical protein
VWYFMESCFGRPMINSGGFADTPIHRISLHKMLPPYHFELQKRK